MEELYYYEVLEKVVENLTLFSEEIFQYIIMNPKEYVLNIFLEK